MKVLIIGLGSIGERHRALLAQRPGLTVAAFSEHRPGPWPNLAAALDSLQPDLVVVSNRTEQHLATLQLLESRLSGKAILVEKPLFSDTESLVGDPRNRIYVGYNLRYHPVLQALRASLAGRDVLHAHVFCGSYLPDWRPDRDYRSCYSASRSLGGGVLRDLSHEIDYCHWLFGPISSLVAVQERVSRLEIDCEDTVEVLARLCSGGLLHLHLDYLCRPSVRRGLIQLDSSSVAFDLVANRLSLPEGERAWTCQRNDTYELEHSDLLGERAWLCTYDQALYVQRVIAAVERSAKEMTWVKL